MAFTSAQVVTLRDGKSKIRIGTFASSSSGTGGAVVTGHRITNHFIANCETSQATTSHLIARTDAATTINQAYATMTTVADETGVWKAVDM